MDKRKKYIMLIDVETVGALNKAVPYDISWLIIDKKGNVYEKRAYIVYEVFNDKDRMETAYYKDKLSLYFKEMAKGNYIMDYVHNIIEQIRKDIKEYRVHTIAAYNAEFDIKALNNLKTEIGFNGNILPKGEYEVWCVWSMACQVLYTQKTFQKVAVKQGWVTKKGNIKTSAEVGYRYITNNYMFEEAHLGLYDALIEKDIMTRCLRQCKKMDKTPNKTCWRIPQKRD